MSRDGSSEYASAIKKGAPQARQVSDRWHLTKNLSACVTVLLTQILTEIRRAEQATTRSGEEEKDPVEKRQRAQTQAVQQAQLARQAERLARYEQIITLRKPGLKNADIATQVGMRDADRSPVAHAWKHPSFAPSTRTSSTH